MTLSATVKGGRPFQDHRRVVEEITSRYQTGIPWQDLPECFGSWQTVGKRHRRFSGDGTWNNMLTELPSQADEAELIQLEVSVDSKANRKLLRDRGIEAVSPEKPDYVACRYDKLALTYRRGVVLRAITIWLKV